MLNDVNNSIGLESTDTPSTKRAFTGSIPKPHQPPSKLDVQPADQFGHYAVDATGISDVEPTIGSNSESAMPESAQSINAEEAASTEVQPAPATPELENFSQTPVAAVATDVVQGDMLTPVVGTSVASAISQNSLSALPSKSLQVDVLPRASVQQALSVIPTKLPKPLEAFFGDCDLTIDSKTGKACIVYKKGEFLVVLSIGSSAAKAFIRERHMAKGLRLKQKDLADIEEDLKAIAIARSKDCDYYTRVAPCENGGVLIDLYQPNGAVVCIDAKGVRMQTLSDAIFLQTPTGKSLPIPADFGDCQRLQTFVNVYGVLFWLLIAWITYTIAHPKVESTKYVFLVLKGTQGSGKSVASKTVQLLIDPSTTGAQTMPGSPRELAILAQSSHLLVFDNLRDLTNAMSDGLCIASTGGTVAMRQLYTDDTQKNLFLHGAMLFNGIHPFMGQSDFADRCLVLNLNPMDGQARKSEKDMQAQFQADYPVILRGLYDLISGIFKHLPDCKPLKPSRMLDFCHWLAAMEMALGLESGVLQKAYADTINEMQLDTLMDNTLAAAILVFAETMTEAKWAGTPTDFYDKLEAHVSFSLRRSAGWPSNAAVMSKRIHGLQAPLETQGIRIELTRGKDRQVVLTLLNGPLDKPKPEPIHPYKGY